MNNYGRLEVHGVPHTTPVPSEVPSTPLGTVRNFSSNDLYVLRFIPRDGDIHSTIMDTCPVMLRRFVLSPCTHTSSLSSYVGLTLTGLRDIG